MATQELDPSVYERAEKLFWGSRQKLVDGGKVKPKWIDDGARFWYRVDTPGGHRFVLVDPPNRTRGPALDHERLAHELAKAAGSDVDPAALPFTTIEFAEGAVEFFAFDSQWRCDLESYSCDRIEDYELPNPLEGKSPDGKWAIIRRGYDLWVRSSRGEETPLTSDGTADYAYGIGPDCLNFSTLMRNLGLPHLSPAVAWSPDSRRVVTHRTDQRGVEMQHLVESSPADGGRPVLRSAHYALPGDDVVPKGELIVFDVEMGTTAPAKTKPLFMPMLSPIMWKALWWAKDGSAVYYFDQERYLKTLRLNRLDPITGEVRVLVEESGEPRMEPGQFMGDTIGRVLSDGREVLWYSQRDGWGHLYLYDGQSGELVGQVTSAEWAVRQILHLDETERVVYFLASGLVADDPYRRQVCRVGLDGSGFTRLTADELDHDVTVPDNEAYFIDSASTVDTPPIITVRDWNGDAIVGLERADITRLEEIGWTPPERFRVKASDGVTDVYGILYRPPDFNPNKRYPVIDHPYPGPQTNRVMPTFDPGPYGSMGEQVAALGFVVVAVDGRGTPGRSKEFHDYSYGRLGDSGSLDDHIAALKQLAETRPWMDLDRVGVFGASGGGVATVRALCAFPDFYKVGVAECGVHDTRIYHLAWGETYDGPLDDETYARSANVEIADRLEGKLLLIHGEMDDNVYPHQTMRLVQRLIAANKDFDLLIVPGAEHLSVGFEYYVTRRRWDFLVRHLMDVEPPAGYRIADVPIDFEAFAEMMG